MVKKNIPGKAVNKESKSLQKGNKAERELIKIKTELLELQAKLKESEDKFLRLAAEFDNYRKRTLREKMEFSKLAGEEFFKSILPVVDDFERALQLLNTSKDMEAMKQGIDLIYNKFRDFLTQNGVKEIESLNQEFNTDLHEAVTQMSVQNEAMKGKVLDVISKGYFLNEKVIRFPKVVVGN